jgi:hypothetical protein
MAMINSCRFWDGSNIYMCVAQDLMAISTDPFHLGQPS